MRHSPDTLNTGCDVTQAQLFKDVFVFGTAGAEPVVVRNLKHSLLNAGSTSSGELTVKQNGSVPRRRTRVGVLISGTGELSFWKEARQDMPFTWYICQRAYVKGCIYLTLNLLPDIACFLCPRHQPAGADRAVQASVQLCRDCGGHLQRTWSPRPQESILGWHPDTGEYREAGSYL